MDVTPSARPPGEGLSNFPNLSWSRRFQKFPKVRPADGSLLADGGISEAVGEGLTAKLKALKALSIDAPMLGPLEDLSFR